jgi:cyclopropane fatty-acyl-phospholipid synthase-like methyltransferase
MRVPPRLPSYLEPLLEGFRRGQTGRSVHLGHWDRPQAAGGERAEFGRAQARLDDLLLEMADLHPGQSVLDVGCGLGGTLQTINLRMSGMALAGLNIDARQIELCRGIEAAHGNRLSWEEGDACCLPFAAASFDRLLCIEAMFHFASRRAFFAEAARVLRPGGVLVASDIVASPAARELETPAFHVAASIDAGFGPWPDLWSHDADHRALAAAAGLHCTQWCDATANTLPSHRFTTPSRRARHDPGDIVANAALMLEWLHVNGHLQYLYLRFDKAAP